MMTYNSKYLPTRRAWRKANPAKVQAYQKAWALAHPERQAYIWHKSRAKNRGVPFRLTFDQWWKIWLDSGHWSDRGRHKDQYDMARRGDMGAYEVGNVYITTHSENVREAHQNGCHR